MKRLFTIIAAVLLTATILAQSPQKMNYQAVIRNNSDQLVNNHTVGMRVSILQGSSTGTPVYVETQSATTNANGLVTIEIGGGTIVTGTFAGIDWSAGTYFIKTETDPTGGTSYSITGTSQLLSVPYALYAKTVASYPETDPVFSAWNKSTGISINASQVSDFQTSVTNNSAVLLNTAKNSYPTADQTKLAGIATGANVGIVPNTGITGATKTKITYDTKGLVTSGADATTADIAASTDKNYVTNAQLTALATIPTAHSIGDSYGGGIVFYVYDNGQHGLIAATADQNTGWVGWTNTASQSTVSNAVRDGINGGLANTESIIIQAIVGSYAALLCANYKGGNYADWYLPSKYELNLLYLQKAVVGGFAYDFYWSSTEVSNIYAWYQAFTDGVQSIGGKPATMNVRAIRAF